MAAAAASIPRREPAPPVPLHWATSPTMRATVAKPNDAFEKRQRELAKKKQDEKQAKKRAERDAARPSLPPEE